jgi:hypothetical protein
MSDPMQFYYCKEIVFTSRAKTNYQNCGTMERKFRSRPRTARKRANETW